MRVVIAARKKTVRDLITRLSIKNFLAKKSRVLIFDASNIIALSVAPFNHLRGDSGGCTDYIRKDRISRIEANALKFEDFIIKDIET